MLERINNYLLLKHKIMKKLMISFVTLLMLSISSNAQTDADEVNFLQTIFGMEKEALVGSFVSPPAESADAFWDIYNSYEVERKELGKRRLALLNTYAEEYGETSDEEMDALIKEMSSISKSSAKIIDKYYKKMKKVHETSAAAFFQIESYIVAKIRVEGLENVPFFGEFE